MICTSPRSGSTYLGQLLSSTGVLGKPLEYFNLPVRRGRNPDYPAGRRQQIRRVLVDGATSNGIYGVKAFANHFLTISKRADPFVALPNLKLVRLKRRDLLGQAISLARARQTGQYSSRAPEHAPPAYDRERICYYVRYLVKEEQAWDAIVACAGVTPLILEYEEVLRDPQGAVDRISAAMGVQEPASIAPEAIWSNVQRDAISAEWRQRFLSETNEQDREQMGLIGG